MKNQNRLHPLSERIVEILMEKSNNPDPNFFRMQVAYFLCLMAANMRVSITGYGDQVVPANCYVINLAPSGTGKGVATNILEDQLCGQFFEVFKNDILPQSSNKHIAELAVKEYMKPTNLYTTEEIETKLQKHYSSLGEMVYSFKQGSMPAANQIRDKCIMANAGALSLQVDEIAKNLLKNEELLTLFYETYDMGKALPKITKASEENKRVFVPEGKVPTNLIAYGSFDSLLDSGRMQEIWIELLISGYARRLLCGFTRAIVKKTTTAKERLQRMLCKDVSKDIEQISEAFKQLANIDLLHTQIHLPENLLLVLLEYQIDNEAKAEKLPSTRRVEALELQHRHWKVLKQVGVYTFLEGLTEITADHLEYAISLVEESGKNFEEMMKLETNYQKLAKYLAEDPTVQYTYADLQEQLPCFRGGKHIKDEILSMAVAWSVKNNIVIKKTMSSDNVLFISGDKLKETSLDSLIISTSRDMADYYSNSLVAWNSIDILGASEGVHFLNHHLKRGEVDIEGNLIYPMGGHRLDTNCLEGFNILVLDLDSGVSINSIVEILKKYNAFIYSTKRHVPDFNRCRVLIPLNYTLALSKEDYKEFINNILADLPFEVDEAGNQRSRKWLTAKSEIAMYINPDGDMFDVIPYLPRTKGNEDRLKSYEKQQDVSKAQRWFLKEAVQGNRNNTLYSYGMLLLDRGYNLTEVVCEVNALNRQLPNPMTEEEISSTIISSISRKNMENKTYA